MTIIGTWVPYGTLYGWIASAGKGNIDTGKGTQTPETAITQAARIKQLEAEDKALKMIKKKVISSPKNPVKNRR